MSVEMLDKIDWADYCPEDRWSDLWVVFERGMQYVDEFNNTLVHRWNMSECPDHMRVWLAELEWTWKTLMRKNWLPREIRQPHDKHIRGKAQGAKGGWDPGNMDFDVVASLLRVWQVADNVSVDRVTHVAAKEYGNRGNKSADGPVNLRGNIIESLLRWTQAMAATPEHVHGSQEVCCVEKYVEWATCRPHWW